VRHRLPKSDVGRALHRGAKPLEDLVIVIELFEVVEHGLAAAAARVEVFEQGFRWVGFILGGFCGSRVDNCGHRGPHGGQGNRVSHGAGHSREVAARNGNVKQFRLGEPSRVVVLGRERARGVVKGPLSANGARVDCEVHGNLPGLVDLSPRVPHNRLGVDSTGGETAHDQVSKFGTAGVAANSRGPRKLGDVRTFGDDRGLKLLEGVKGGPGEFGEFGGGETCTDALLNLLGRQCGVGVVLVAVRGPGPRVPHRMAQFIGDGEVEALPGVGLHHEVQAVLRGSHEVHTRHDASVPRPCRLRAVRRAAQQRAARPVRHDGRMETDPALIDELLNVARAVASEAADLIIEGRHSAEVTRTKSSGVDIVTQMDVAAETLIRQRLHKLRPGDGVLGEEGQDHQGRSGITWVVDPIDGTVNYLYGLPSFAVSIAAVTGPPTTREWTALAGAVHDGTGRLWSAARGRGATLNDAVISRGDAAPLSQTLLATGFQYIAARRAVQGEIVARLLPQVRDIRRLGAAAVDLCLVASGHLDAYYEHGLNAWDLAAGALIASEAGATVAGIDGGPPDEHLTIAAAPEVWVQLRDALRAAGADHPFDALESASG
jgi:myo-inositol-1(or 4)-monophosphatase